METTAGVLFFYFQWADEMNVRFRSSAGGDALAAMYLRTWLGALHALVEGWPSVGASDAAVDALLACRTGRKYDRDGVEVQETYPDLLRRVRNAVFHFSSLHNPPAVAKFLDTPGALGWANNLHACFRSFFDKLARHR